MNDHQPTRRSLLLSSLTAATGLAGCLSKEGTEQSMQETDETGANESARSGNGTQSEQVLSQLTLTGAPIATGLTSPVDVAALPNGDLFVADQVGVLYRHDGDGLADEPALDIRDRMASFGGRSEMGLLGVALHPSFDENGQAYVRYSAPPNEQTPSGYSHTFVLSSFQATDDRTRLTSDSERVLLTIPQPQSNHNAGSIAFGPDGYLYVGVGDGGGGGDSGRGHVSDWYDGRDGGNGQDVTENLLGSVLRLDVDAQAADEPYEIPPDNPLVGKDGLDEHFAWGFRNPWRFSFGPDGRFFVADVGQSDWEEIDLVEAGGNYGWNVREGPSCYRSGDCPDATDDGEPLLDPIISYPHSDGAVSGISVIGGYVYSGQAIPVLQDRYVFADFRSNGTVFVATEDESGDWAVRAVPLDGTDSLIHSFGRDPDGELLVCTTKSGRVDTEDGTVYRIESAS